MAPPANSASESGEWMPQLPIHISLVGGRHLIFDVDIAMWLRKEHRMCGMTIGTLPQIPSQNVFLGLPVELMPEEAYFLAETGIGLIIDEANAHRQALTPSNKPRRRDYYKVVQDQTQRIEAAKAQEKKSMKAASLKKKRAQISTEEQSTNTNTSVQNDTTSTSDSLFDFDDATPTQQSNLNLQPFDIEPQDLPKPRSSTTTHSDPPQPQEHSQAPLPKTYHYTPTTSHHLLPSPPSPSPSQPLPPAPPSYALYKHLHNNSYFLTPGLRFGCQYTVYPGDPLRFHSHFLAVHTAWDEELDLMDILGGGRLGTGVKKGFLFGGLDPRTSSSFTSPSSVESSISSGGGVGNDRSNNSEKQEVNEERVRTFSVEWAAM